jgi:hydroxymethylglutaryl-CoA lyase
VDEFNLVMSVSEAHNHANLKMSCEDSFQALNSVIQLAHANQTATNVSLSTSFGCPMSGVTPLQDLMLWIQRFADLGVRGISLCDTTGMANPEQVKRMCGALQQQFPHLQLTLHFHNTRGMGLANILAAVQSGIVRFDGSLGGLGGCPYAPGASGNVSSEDAIHMLDAMGYDTGMNIPKLIQLAKELPVIVGHEVPGQVAKAGSTYTLHSEPSYVEELRRAQ